METKVSEEINQFVKKKKKKKKKKKNQTNKKNHKNSLLIGFFI